MTRFFDGTKKFLPGLWLNSGSETAAEIAAQAGFEWLLIDCEHGLITESALLSLLRTISGYNVVPVVRIPSADSPLLERALDFGAGGIMVPGVETSRQAAKISARMQYPPHGCRGVASSVRAADYGLCFQSYFCEAGSKLALICQIETCSGVENAEEIAALNAVTGLFIGHSDLSMNLGCFGDWDSPAVKDAEDTVLQACRTYHKLPGMLLKNGQSAESFRQKGFRMIALGSDSGLLKSGCARLLDVSRNSRTTEI